ncbi:hypothetical protein ERUR111494_06265 [Erysipelothrix urinaevulpis]|uniref:hypothetical protein n=1 Tax=Erysipelothrix urinaevulpis TaxID=2683717 RepID=UPI00135AB80C|nr:hypothetical protein [Erysipelothrix urinaevulpis]
MIKKSYSIKEYINEYNYTNIEGLIKYNQNKFHERFGMEFQDDIDVELNFETFRDANDFYQELKYNSKYSDFSVFTTHSPNKLIISGAKTLFDYFGTREPNLLTLSRDLGIRFEILFNQDYSGSIFTGSVVSGELLSRQLIIEVSEVLPELSLAGLGQIAKTLSEFDLLLTRIYSVEGVRLI